jgi:EAL domain-containing protein (putative c-di-GMP-specific phosphodiesterase class I)
MDDASAKSDAPARDPSAEHSLRHALSHNEFVLYGQPILSLQGAEDYTMAEVLVRMSAEEDYLLPPGEFFPAFEHYGLMPELDRWVCAQAIRLLARSPVISVLCINLHRQTLADEGFADSVAYELARARVEGASLVFELSETDVHALPEVAERATADLRRHGCWISIGGVNGGAESLATVKRLRPEMIKIDGNIIRHVLDDHSAELRLKALTRMSQILHLSLIAEFVEDREVLDRLRALGVSYAQGFGIFKPMLLKRLLFPLSQPGARGTRQ